MVRSDFHGVHGILQKLKWILFFITGMRQKPTSKSVNWTILKPTNRKFNFYYLLLINNSIYCGLYKNLIYFKLIHAIIIHIWNANANNSQWEPTYAATISKNCQKYNWNEFRFILNKWTTIVGSWVHRLTCITSIKFLNRECVTFNRVFRQIDTIKKNSHSFHIIIGSLKYFTVEQVKYSY